MALLGGQKLLQGSLLSGGSKKDVQQRLPFSRASQHHHYQQQPLKPVLLPSSPAPKFHGLLLPPVRVAAADPPAPPASLLPWQLSDVKKRADLKKIMIIGAGPIIIGQVSASRSECQKRDTAEEEVLLVT